MKMKACFDSAAVACATSNAVHCQRRQEMKILRWISLVCSALLLIGTVRAARAQTIYDLKGRVYGPDSKPVPNVLVILQNNARVQIGQDITGTEGLYEFNGLIAGTYYISIKPGETRYQGAFTQIELLNTSVGGRSSSVETVDFTLKYTSRASPMAATVYVQPVPAEAEKEYLDALNSLKKGEKQQAINRLRKAIEIFPTYYFALAQLGVLFVEQARYEDAIEPLKKAILVNPKGSQAHLGLGIALLNLDRSKDAISDLRLAHQLDPRSFLADLYLGMALISMGELEAAETSLKEALTLGGGSEARLVHLYLASVYDKRKQYKLAIEELEIYVRENPKAANVNSVKEAIKKVRAKT